MTWTLMSWRRHTYKQKQCIELMLRICGFICSGRSYEFLQGSSFVHKQSFFVRINTIKRSERVIRPIAFAERQNWTVMQTSSLFRQAGVYTGSQVQALNSNLLSLYRHFSSLIVLAVNRNCLCNERVQEPLLLVGTLLFLLSLSMMGCLYIGSIWSFSSACIASFKSLFGIIASSSYCLWCLDNTTGDLTHSLVCTIILSRGLSSTVVSISSASRRRHTPIRSHVKNIW